MNGKIETQTKVVHRKQILDTMRTKKTSDKKHLFDNTNKAIMYVLTSFALLFFTFTMLFIIFRGINAFSVVDGQE